MHWLKISIILSVFGFLKEFRPSEPFVTDYLTGPWKNFTEEQVMFVGIKMFLRLQIM